MGTRHSSSSGGHVHLTERKRAGQADALDLHVAVQDLHLPPQGDKLVRGDAEAQDVRQVGGHEGHLGHLVDLADPLHGVQGVAEEVGVELGLEHPDLGLVQLPLVFHQLLLVALQGHHHAVEALGQLAQLVVLIGWDVDVQIVVDHLADGAVEPLDGIEHLPAQPQAHQHGEAHAHQGAAHRHRGQQAAGYPGSEPGAAGGSAYSPISS